MESSALFMSMRHSSGHMCCQRPFFPGITLIESPEPSLRYTKTGKHEVKTSALKCKYMR